MPTTDQHQCALLWLRRDLRLTDNPALSAALATARCVVPVYIDDPAAEGEWALGAASRAWLHHSLSALNLDLRRRGSRLILCRGESAQVLARLAQHCGASLVMWNRRYERQATAHERQVASTLAASGVDTASYNASLWAEPGTLSTQQGDPYRVFTPFWRALSARLFPRTIDPAPDRIPPPSQWPDSLALEALNLTPAIPWDQGFWAQWQPGEAGAQKRLQRFIASELRDYHRNRDFPGRTGGSRLSPHLHFGEIGPQQVLVAVEQARARSQVPEGDAEHFLRELGWREFAHHLLHHFPHTDREPLNATFANFPWRAPTEYADDLRAWQRGRTGIPIVDAGMRELWQTGWMHNRVRMIVASLLCKNLRIPWQEGARWFWDTLVDADLANNSLGWQWVAGCGADAAPYFRIFNPVLQSQKFDATGHYIRQWVPELRELPPSLIQKPWTTAASAATGYPRPIVDLASSRNEALDAYAQLRSS